MAHLTLADQYERIVARCGTRSSTPSHHDDDDDNNNNNNNNKNGRRTNNCDYTYWRNQDLLEKRLLGIVDDADDSYCANTSSNDDDDGEESQQVVGVQVEVSAVDGDDDAVHAEVAPTSPTTASLASPRRKLQPKQNQHVTTYNPLGIGPLSLPNNLDGQWSLIATGAVLAISAIALSMYLSGGLATSATAAAALSSSCTPAATGGVDKFQWFVRGGGSAATYSYMYTAAASRVSVGLGAILRHLRVTCSPPTVATYVTKRAIPSALRMLKKMAIMEVWRRVWILTFHQMSRGTKQLSRGTVHVYQTYTPFWIRRGLQSMFKSTVQKAVHGTVGSWVGMAAGGASDFVAGMLSTQMEAVVQEAAEEMVEAVVRDTVEEAVETACGGAVEAAIIAIGSD